MEEVLVIPAELYFEHQHDEGALLRAARKHCSFLSRDTVEEDPRYKQIIPYVFARHGENVLVLTRLEAQSEKRLQGKLSLGIGGHINPVDGRVGEDPFLAGLRRELAEEVRLPGAGEPAFRGVISDESTPVGRVHLGLVYALDCPYPEFEVMEKDKMRAEWMDHSRVAALYGAFESWSQIVFDRFVRS